MRALLFAGIGVVVGVGGAWIVTSRPALTGWEAVCAARGQQAVERALHAVNVHAGLHGWHPTPEWVAAQCEVLYGTRSGRLANPH